MSETLPLSAEDTLEAIKTIVSEGKDETSIAALSLLESYRAGVCEQNWRVLVGAFSSLIAGQRMPGLEASDSRITIRGATTTFCPFCGAELPKHRLPTEPPARTARVPYAAV